MKSALTLFQLAAHSVGNVMGRLHALLAAFALLCATGIAAPASSQVVAAPCLLCNPSAGGADDGPVTPVTLDVETKLDFDRLILTGRGIGTAELRPDGSRMVSGSVSAISARAMLGEVAVRGEPGRQVRVELPHSIELIGFNGGSIRLEAIRSDLPPVTRLDSNGLLTIRFGGVVHVSGDTDGEFRGDVRVIVEYF